MNEAPNAGMVADLSKLQEKYKALEERYEREREDNQRIRIRLSEITTQLAVSERERSKLLDALVALATKQ